MSRRESEEQTVLRLLADGPRKAVYENRKIVFEEGTAVSRRVMGHLCNAEPPRVMGAIRPSADDGGVPGYLYEITAAGRELLGSGDDDRTPRTSTAGSRRDGTVRP